MKNSDQNTKIDNTVKKYKYINTVLYGLVSCGDPVQNMGTFVKLPHAGAYSSVFPSIGS